MRNPTAIGALPPAASRGAQECSVLGTLALVGDFWALGILRSLLHGLTRFAQLQRELGVASNVLTDRLNRLVDAEVVERVPYGPTGSRFRYELTAAGRDLAPAVLALKRWGDRHLPHDGPPSVWRHAGCTSPAEVQVRCPDCDRPVGLPEMEAVEHR
ncbi:MAG TPA: helix-turn-helix domain-containing protein [Egibacteraceae bacterium]|nr:helix-turn-helix domain-containing protein [Egibacteraceae bacterium]